MRILGAAVVLLLLAGCTSEPPVEPVETVETETPTSEPVEFAAPPIQLFNGSCSEIVDPKELRSAVAGAWLQGDGRETLLEPRGHVVENVGGLRCGWGTDDGQYISIAALPADAASAPEDTSCGFQTDASAFSCAIDVTANSIRFAGLYGAGSGDATTLGATVAAIEALFTASALTAVSVSAPALDSAWPSAPDCAALDVPGYELEEYVLGTDVFFAPAVLSLTRGISLPQCGVLDTNVDFAVLGGGRWMEAAVRAAPGAEEVDIDGLELVILVPWEGEDVYSVNVFDGDNWLQVRVSDADEKIYPVLIDVIDALNAL